MTERNFIEDAVHLFIEDAVHLLSEAETGDTVVVAVARPGGFMIMLGYERDPNCLVAAARSLLDQAAERLEEIEDEPRDLRRTRLQDGIREALEALPDPDDDAEER